MTYMGSIVRERGRYMRTSTAFSVSLRGTGYKTRNGYAARTFRRWEALDKTLGLPSDHDAAKWWLRVRLPFLFQACWWIRVQDK